MKINEFFAVRLGVPVRHPVQSWGAHDQSSNRVFLRVGGWAIDDYTDGKRWAIVYEPKWRKSFGHAERKQHLAAIERGAEGYVLVVEFNDKGKIKSFNDQTLLRIGDIEDDDGLTYAQIIDEVTVGSIVASSQNNDSVAADIETTFSREITQTQRKTMIEARVGQGAFRDDVLKLWSHRCAVTGVTVVAAIRASHIKPWKICADEERLDPYNGLPLVATLDALFDRGLITFAPTGHIVISPALKSADRRLLSLKNLRLSMKPCTDTADYLAFHSEEVFQK